MRRACRTTLLTLAIAGVAYAQTSVPIRHVNRTQLMRDVTTLGGPAFEGRAAGSPGGLRARRWIVDRFRGVGLAPSTPAGYEHPFPVNGRSAANVIGTVDGSLPSSNLLIVTAHYDHVGVRDGVLYPGADDNASGVAVLLAAAQYFLDHAPRHPMVFAALDAEETGQEGAKALLASNLLPRARLALNINLDMVSRSAVNELYAAGTSYSPWQAPILREVQSRAAVTIRLGHDRAGASNGLEDWTHASDHGPFHDAGVPFVYFGVEDHPDYHKPTDVPERIDPRFFGDAADTIVEALRTFDVSVP